MRIYNCWIVNWQSERGKVEILKQIEKMEIKRMMKTVLFEYVLFDCLLVNFCSFFKSNIWMFRQNLDCHCSFKQKEFFSSLEIRFSFYKLLELRLHHCILIFIKKGVFELLEKLICEFKFKLEYVCRWLLYCSCQFN